MHKRKALEDKTGAFLLWEKARALSLGDAQVRFICSLLPDSELRLTTKRGSIYLS